MIQELDENGEPLAPQKGNENHQELKRNGAAIGGRLQSYTGHLETGSLSSYLRTSLVYFQNIFLVMFPLLLMLI